MATDIVSTPPPNLNISELSRQHGVDRRTIKRWMNKGWAPPVPATIKIVEQSQEVPTDAHPPGRHGRHWIMGLCSGALGLALAGVGLVINARYAASLGATSEDAWLLATLGLAIDAGAVIGLSITALLWQGGRLLSAAAAFLLWVGFSVMSAIATAGFTSQSIGDFAAGRASVIEAATDQRQQRLEKIASGKMAVAAAMVARDQECGRVGPNCRQRVAELNARQAELTVAVDAPIVASASVSVADPGAHMLAGLTGVDQALIQKLRIAGLTAAPITAGLFLAFATMLL